MVRNTSKTLSKNLFLFITLSLPVQLFPEAITQPTIQTVSNICNNYEELKIVLNNQDSKNEIISFIEHNFIDFINYPTNTEETLKNILQIEPEFRNTLRTLYEKNKDTLTDTQKQTLRPLTLKLEDLARGLLFLFVLLGCAAK